MYKTYAAPLYVFGFCRRTRQECARPALAALHGIWNADFVYGAGGSASCFCAAHCA